MTKKKGSLVFAGIVIIGIVSVLLLFPNLFNVTQTVGSSGEEIAWEERLLEYAELGLSFDGEINVFFYNEQSVRRLVDGSSLFTHDDGALEITITRNSEGEITEFDIR